MSSINFRPPYYLDDKEIQAFRNGSFEIHCLSIKLVRPEPKPDKILGSGFIRQKENSNRFEFVIYSKKTASAADIVDEFIGNQDLRPGQIYPKSYYYSLECTDDKGRKWKGERILKPGVKASRNGTVVFGNFDQIWCRGKLPSKINTKSINLDFKGEYKIPFNVATHIDKTVGNKQVGGSSSRNVLEFKYKKNDFSISNENQYLQVEIKSKEKKLSDNFETRVSESLQFVTGHAMSWSKKTKFYGKTGQIALSTNLQKNYKGVEPPISGAIGNDKDFCNLFSCYMNYISSSKDITFHPISGHIRSIALASSVNVETLALVLSVSVESILSYTNITKALTKDELSWLKKAKKYFSNENENSAISKRISGFLNSIENNTSAKDIFNELINAKVTTKRHVKAWETLRHKLAHGGRMGSIPLQEFLDLTYTVLTLFYHLIFYIIDYQGKYIDYSIPEWSEENYPLDKNYK